MFQPSSKKNYYSRCVLLGDQHFEQSAAMLTSQASTS